MKDVMRVVVLVAAAVGMTALGIYNGHQKIWSHQQLPVGFYTATPETPYTVTTSNPWQRCKATGFTFDGSTLAVDTVGCQPDLIFKGGFEQ